MPSQEEIDKQQELLSTHRATLAILLTQQARHTKAYTPPATEHGILEARANIRRVKNILRSWGVSVVDDPDDEDDSFRSSQIPTSSSSTSAPPPDPATTAKLHPQTKQRRIVQRDLTWWAGIAGIAALVVALAQWLWPTPFTSPSPSQHSSVPLGTTNGLAGTSTEAVLMAPPTPSSFAPMPTSTPTPEAAAALLAYRCKPTGYTTDQICVRRANGPEQPPLTHDSVYAASYPVWSPNGRQITFVSNRSGQQDIWVMDADGNNQCNLTGPNLPGTGTNCPPPQNNPELLKERENHPAWSPDGNKIAFVASTNPITSTNTGDIWVMDANGSNPRNLTNSPSMSESYPTWSPDGSKIAFASAPLTNTNDLHIWVMDANGANPRPLTVGKFPLGAQATEWAPAWSPNGVWIAFISANDALVRGRLDKDIWVISPDGSIMQSVTPGDQDDADPAWSPDSTQIVFILSHKIQAVKVDGTNRYDFWPQHSPQGEFEPDWSPNKAQSQ